MTLLFSRKRLHTPASPFVVLSAAKNLVRQCEQSGHRSAGFFAVLRMTAILKTFLGMFPRTTPRGFSLGLVLAASVATCAAQTIQVAGDKVGIGTPQPTTSLHLLGPFTAGYMQLTVQATGSDDRSGISFLNKAGSRVGELYVGEAGDFIFGRDQAGQIRFFSNGAERLTISSAGNVGIGTANPNTKLHVAGNATFANEGIGSYSFGQAAAASPKQLIIETHPAENYALVGTVQQGIGFNQALVFQRDGGNVGIGTVSPSNTLHIVRTADPQLKIGYDASNFMTIGVGATAAPTLTFNNDARFYQSAMTAGLIFKTNNGPITFHTDNGESSPRIYVSSAGNVGVGTTNPGAKLEIAVPPGGADGLQISRPSSPTWQLMNYGPFYLQEGGIGPRLVVAPGGNVGIGTTNPVAKLDVNGGIRFSSADGATKMALGLTGKNVSKRSDYTGDTSYWTGSMGWANAYDWNSIFWQGDGFFDNWGTDMAGAPEAGYVHAQGIQVEHYSNGSTGYGWQMMSGNAVNGNWYLRGIWGGGFGSWYKILHSGNIGSQSVAFANAANYLNTAGLYYQGGNVGIGTSNPMQKLQFAPNSFIGLPGGSGTYVPISWQRGTSGLIMAGSSNPDGSGWAHGSRIVSVDYGDGMNFEVDTVNASAWTNSALVVSSRNGRQGNVGIGTSSPDYKLTVAGPVRATQFIGNVNTWSDSVFKPGYRLSPLSEVEAAIHENGHLPEIPSEAEVKRDGVDMAQMQAKLLQKIEELTLHLIEQDKRMALQEARLRSIEQENSALKAGTPLR